MLSVLLLCLLSPPTTSPAAGDPATSTVIMYHVHEETSKVPDKMREIILAGLDPSVRDTLVWPGGVYDTANVLVLTPGGVRAERKLLRYNDQPVEKLERPTIYPLEQICVWLQDGSYQEATSSPTPPANLSVGIVDADARPYPADLVLDVFLGRRGWQMKRAIAAGDVIVAGKEGEQSTQCA